METLLIMFELHSLVHGRSFTDWYEESTKKKEKTVIIEQNSFEEFFLQRNSVNGILLVLSNIVGDF